MTDWIILIFDTSPRQQSVQNMKRPYGNCSEGDSREKLTAECVQNRTRDAFVRQSPMSIVKTGNDMMMLSNSDLEKKSWKRHWRKIARECNNWHQNITGCTEQRLITAVDERRIGDNLTIYEMIPSLPSMEYSHNPQMDIENFILFIFAILSTGFGFALYTCLPCRWDRTRKTAPCCGCGFTSDIPDPDEKRVIDLEKAQTIVHSDLKEIREANDKMKKELRTLKAKFNQSVSGQAQETVASDERANLKDEMGNLYEFRKIDRQKQWPGFL